MWEMMKASVEVELLRRVDENEVLKEMVEFI
jgi:hypothetical protein